MKVLERKMESCRLELEALYLRARAGEDCMGEVMQASRELDRLIAELAVQKKKGRSPSA